MIVVTGATGNVGRPLVRALAKAGEKVTAVSRRGSEAEHLEGVAHRQADLAEPASLKPVLDGADALYLLIAGAGESLNPHDILDVAKSAGVRRVVLQTSQLLGTRPDVPSHAHLRSFEDALRESGREWTVLRPSGFASNAYMWAEAVRSQRAIAAPFADVALPVIDPDDIAEVAAVALREDGHSGRMYELTGPAPVSPREQARALGQALGEPVRFIEQSRAEARAQLLRFMPESVVDGTLSVLGEPSSAEQRVSPAVEELLGRPAGTFDAWAERNVAAFR